MRKANIGKRQSGADTAHFYNKLGLCGLGILGFGWIIAVLGVSSLEESIFRTFNNLPEYLLTTFSIVTFGGTLLFAVLASVIMFVNKKSRVALRFVLAGGMSWVIITAIKSLEIRPRPSGVLPNVNVREAIDTMSGFPSGHTAIAAAIGVTAAIYLPNKYRLAICITIAAVAISRLYLGMHFLTDTIGGLGVGMISVFIVESLLIKLKAAKINVSKKR